MTSYRDLKRVGNVHDCEGDEDGGRDRELEWNLIDIRLSIDHKPRNLKRIGIMCVLGNGEVDEAEGWEEK